MKEITLKPIGIVKNNVKEPRFGNFAEEYGGAKIPRGSKNCVSSCEKFSDEIDSCEIECSQSNFYRSIPSGVMRTLSTSNYGIYNIELLNKLLQDNKPQETAITGNPILSLDNCDKDILSVDITSNSNNEITAETNNILLKGCAPDNAGDGNLCFDKLCYPDVIFTDGQNNQTQETLEGEVIPYQENSIFYIERNLNQPSAQITLNGELIETLNTAQAGATACHL